MLQHVCGQCAKHFTSQSAYLNHVCPSTGFNPRQLEHQTPLVKPVTPPTAPPTPTVKFSEKALLSAVRAARRSKKYV